MFEQRRAFCRSPRAIARRARRGRDLPIRFEPAEVIDAQQIEELELRADARAPPRETVGLQARPVVERIAPLLPVLREVVRWHAGDDARHAAGIEEEILAMRPDLH